MFVPIAWWIVCRHIASAIVLVVTRVQFPYRGPLLIPLASLHPVLSCLLSILSCPLKSKDHKYNLEKKSKCMVIINMITIWFMCMFNLSFSRDLLAYWFSHWTRRQHPICCQSLLQCYSSCHWYQQGLSDRCRYYTEIQHYTVWTSVSDGSAHSRQVL